MEIVTQTRPKVKQGVLARLLNATPEQSRDTGMALVLLCLLLTYFWQLQPLLPLALILLLVTMVWPRAFRPLAGLWFGLAQVMGAVMSNVILTVLFFVLVTPVGLVRRVLGADALQLKKWKKGHDSVFAVRGELTHKEELEATSGFLRDLWAFLRERKKYWLLPIIIVLLFFGVLIVLTGGSAIAPFIYTIF